MQVFKPTYTDKRSGTKKTTKTWFVRINGKRHSLGVTDRRVAQRRASELLLEIEGGVRPRNRSRRAPQAILDHVDRFARSLVAKGCTAQHVALVVARLKAVFEGTAIRKLEDAPIADVDAWLAAQQAAGVMSARTRRHHAAHLRQFGRYLQKEAIVAESPFANVTLAVHVESDRRLQRRALPHGPLPAARADPKVGLLGRRHDRPPPQRTRRAHARFIRLLRADAAGAGRGPAHEEPP
jgi:hypothetical protein